MAGTRTPVPFESQPAELPEPWPSSLPSNPPPLGPSSLPPMTSPIAVESADSDGTVRPVEIITMTTIRDMLARVLEQTSALWQAQASTNHTLDELRRSMPALQESAEIHERLCRVEALVGTSAQGQPPDLYPSAQPGTITASSASTLGPNVHTHHSEDGDEEVPPTNPLLSRIDQPTADPATSVRKVSVPTLQRGRAPATPSFLPTIEEDEEVSDPWGVGQGESEQAGWEQESFATDWRGGWNTQGENVPATVNEQVPFDVQAYLDEFSGALSTEIRMLLSEVGKLREERRGIQHEIGYLMVMQSTLVPGGEFGIDWPSECSSPHAWPSPAGIPLPESPQPRPGWRTVSARRNRHASRPEPPPAPERQDQSWTIWQPNPALQPLWTPELGSPGLFGPRSPCGDPYPVLPAEIEEPDSEFPNPNRHVHSWTT